MTDPIADDLMWTGLIYEPTRVRASGLVVPLGLEDHEPQEPGVYEIRWVATGSLQPLPYWLRRGQEPIYA